MEPKLTPRQQAFVDAYTGNATDAARQAGYSAKTAHAQACKLMKLPHVRDAIQERDTKRRRARVKNRDQLQRFWSETIDNGQANLTDRLRASELLGKSRGEFSAKLEVKGELQLVDLVRESMSKGPASEG